MIPIAILMIVLLFANVAGWIAMLSWVKSREDDARATVRAVDVALQADRERAAREREAWLKERTAEFDAIRRQYPTPPR